MVAGGMLGPIYAVYVAQIGGSLLDVGWSWAIFSLFAGFLTLLMAKIEEHKNLINMVILGYFLKVGGFFGYIFVGHTYQLFALQMLLGISTAISVPAYDALFSRYLDKGKESFGWGMWEASAQITSAVAAVVGSTVVFYLGFTVLFSAMTFLALFGLLLFIHSIKKRGRL